MIRRFLLLLVLDLSALPAVAQNHDNVPSVLEGDAIVRRNGIYYNNRPLYAGQDNPDQRYYWAFAGDRPFLQFGGGPHVDGCFLLGFQPAGGAAKWLLDFKSVEARYRPGRMEWVASDPEFPGVPVALEALPLGTGFGLAAQTRVTGAAVGDRLVWMFGAAHSRWVNHIDAMAADSAHVRYEGFDPARATGNGVEVNAGVVRLDQARGHKGRHTQLACNTVSEIRTVDAGQWKNPSALLASAGDKCPIACGLTPIVNQEPITWIARVWPQKDSAAPDIAAEYRAACERVERMGNRVVSRTPDPRFDFMVRAASSPADCLWRKAAFGHGCLSAFVDPLLGWRSTLAGVAYGWHDRVLKAGQTFLASQVTGESYKDHPELAKIVEHNIELDRFEGTLCHPARDPRFFSRGRLIPNQNSTLYDMQSQFIDALVEDWRFTADPEMEKLLRPALEMHLEYLARAFDPDGDGTYESFNNTFLTDTVWFNGGGTPDETAFAWRGHLAARDMARRAGDEAAIKRHEARLALIRKGFFEKLWVERAGHPGAYREQGGHQRLHAEAWLPGLYLPLDCPGLMNDQQQASTLHFVEYALEHEPRPTGGVRVWPSNWVPSIWTNRWKAPGDEYHMALGYCLAGMPEGAMEIIQGNISEGAFESSVPGNLGFTGASCGTDFGDCVAAFCRVVVSGIFGYRPDRPNGLVTVAPQFPAAWDRAEFEHPEFKLAYRHEGTAERLSVDLQRESAMQLQLPFRGTAVKVATFNGQPVPGQIMPGFGRSIFVVRTPVAKKAELIVTVDHELPAGRAESRELEVGAAVELAVEGGRMTELRDAQRVLKSPTIAQGKANARIARNVGNHRVLALVQMGAVPQYRIFDFKVRDPQAEQFAAEKNLRQAPPSAQWMPIDLSGLFNGRVSELYLQDYISPRPDTVSLRLARDAHGVWNAVYAGKLPPGIDLSATRPPRPAPVYEAVLGELKDPAELTLEVWLSADMFSMAGAEILEMGDLSLDMLSWAGRLVRIVADKKPVIHGTSPLSGERLTHLAIVLRSGKSGQVYFDGKKYIVETEPFDLAALKLGPTLRLGADRSGGRRFMGQISRVAISTRAAGPEALKGRTLTAPPLPGAVADWRIPEAAPAEVAASVPGCPALVRREVPFKRPADMPRQLPVADGLLTVPQGAQFKWTSRTHHAPRDVLPHAEREEYSKDIAFTSLWDNWPRKAEVPVNKKGESAWLLVAGSTNPMQVGIANAVVRFAYADGVTEELELVNPRNFWSLSTFVQADYNYATDAFALPKEPPSQVQLGTNCRAMVYGWKLRPGVVLKQVTLETLSQEVVIGLMGLSICNPRS